MMNAFGWLKGGRWLLCVWALLLVSCLPDAPQQITTLPECVPASNLNPYNTKPTTWASMIFNFATSGGSESLQQGRYAAFLFLAEQTQRWSDFTDIHISDSENMRITITYVSPELVSAVYLNRTLTNNGNIMQDFDDQMMSIAMSQIAGGNEFIFLITVTSTQYNGPIANSAAYTFKIPIDQMKLTNSADISTLPKHYDNNLAEYNRITYRPIYGYVAYQMGIKKDNGNCEPFLDQTWDKSITFNVPNLQVNDTDHGSQTWTIKYKPLLDIGSSSDSPAFISPPNNDLSYISPSSIAPDPVMNEPNTDTTYWSNYWQQMGRFVWSELTLTNPK